MAAKVGLKEAEYQDLQTDLPQIHTDNLEQIEKVLTKIESLNQRGGGFYLTEITPKVEKIVEELNSIKNSMSSAYETNGEIVGSFVRTIDNYDTLC